MDSADMYGLETILLAVGGRDETNVDTLLKPVREIASQNTLQSLLLIFSIRIPTRKPSNESLIRRTEILHRMN